MNEPRNKGPAPSPRVDADEAYRQFMAMSAEEWKALVFSLLRGGRLTPAEQRGFDRAMEERK